VKEVEVTCEEGGSKEVPRESLEGLNRVSATLGAGRGVIGVDNYYWGGVAGLYFKEYNITGRGGS
jgi:hypothetical protein